MSGRLYPLCKRGSTCCAVNCSMTSGTNALSRIRMFRFPRDAVRRRAWANAVNRKNWMPTDSSRICSKHFLEGQPSKDPSSPDWIPSLFSHKKNAATQIKSAMDRYDRLKRRRLQGYIPDKPSDPYPGDTEEQMIVHASENGQSCHDAITQTDGDVVTVPSFYLEELQQTISTLEAKCLQNMRTPTKEILDDDKLVEFYTGLPNKKLFEQLVEYAESSNLLVNNYNLTRPDQLMLTLMKLKQGLVNKDLAFRFDVSVSTVSKIFHDWLQCLYKMLNEFIFWPSMKSIKASLPPVFQDPFFKNVRCIIDCSEIPIQRPCLLKARAQTFSHYKGKNTVKFLIAICPNGFISFVSRAWGGRVSDKEFTKNCRFLDHLQEGHVVLADRGFNISDLLALKGVKLIIPSFTRGKKQLHGREVSASRRMSRARIHVERVIG